MGTIDIGHVIENKKRLFVRQVYKNCTYDDKIQIRQSSYLHEFQ